MSRLRIVIIVLVFAGLGLLELGMGFDRLRSLRANRLQELRSGVTRAHHQLASRLTDRLGWHREQARLVARQLEPGQPLRDPAIARVVDWLADRPDVDALWLVGADGVPAPWSTGTGGDPPGPAPTEDELARVLERGALLFELRPDGEGRGPLVASRAMGGAVVLGLAAGPFQEVLRDFQPWQAARTRLFPLPDEGASNAGREETPGAEADDHGEGSDAPGGGLVQVTLLRRDGPELGLETRVPAAAVEAAMDPLQREYTWIIVSMIAVTLALGLVGALVLRLGLRAMRLNETEHYLRWIRRVTDRYRALLEGAADMILIFDAAGTLREANAAGRRALDLPPEDGEGPDEAAQRPAPETRAALADRFAAEDAERFEQALARAAGGLPEALDVSGLRLHGADGRERVADARFACVDVGGEQVVQVSLRDVTEQRTVERRLHTAERLSSLGLLTAGVAHEINNPLEGMGNYLALIEREGLDGERRSRYVGELRRGLHRIRDIVSSLLSFARPDVETGRSDLRQVVDNALNVVRYAPEFRGVEVERQGLDAELAVALDGGRLEQVVLNLLLNAGRAMEGAGRVTLAARREQDPDGRGWVVLDVSDDGPGLDPTAIDRLFDPFYSGSGGTGLGLSVSFGIVEAHGGSLRARNGAEGGAVFSVRLPEPFPASPRSEP